MGTPEADIRLDEDLVVRLLAAQHPDLASHPVRFAANGWDNAIFRLGDDLAVRLPRRAAAVRLIQNEQRFLPLLRDRLPLPVPAPVRLGVPDPAYPWPWSVTPWFSGETSDVHPPAGRESLALVRFFEALHVPPPADMPRNPVRGVPLAGRADAFERRVASLAGRGVVLPYAIHVSWDRAVQEPIDVAPTWIHGDPHARNILVTDGRLSAVIDWGDMGQGDRASDLAAFWMLFDRDARTAGIRALRSVSDSTWRRARGWALLYAVVFLDTGLQDDTRMAVIGRKILTQLLQD